MQLSGTEFYVHSGKKVIVTAIKENNFSTSFICSKTALVILYHRTDTKYLGITVALATSVLRNTYVNCVTPSSILVKFV